MMTHTMTMTPATRFLSTLLLGAVAWSMCSVPSATAQHGRHEKANHKPRAEGHEMEHAGGPISEMHSGETSRHPLRHATMQALVLPALADTLGLSADQKRRLEELRGSFLSEQKARRKKLHDQKKKIHQLFRETGMPELEAVRPEIKLLFQTREQLKMAPYMTATDMREVLTEEQEGRLSELSRRARRHAVMANMTMQEHMRIKQALRGNQHEGKHHAKNRAPHMKSCQMRHDGSEKGENHGPHHGHTGK